MSIIKNKKKLLLHCCCAPCAAYVIEIMETDYDLTLLFYNPNIHPVSEYEQRLEELERFSKIKGLDLLVGNYNVAGWLKGITGHEDEPERGQRCQICYYNRLAETAKTAEQKKFNFWTTTLSVSPHKDADMINKIGMDLARETAAHYLPTDFKKNNGYKKSVTISKEYGFYRQNYCGCLYSQIKRIFNENEKKEF